MGRPREHDEATRTQLRGAAERLVAGGGPDALSVRAVADEARTSTRAVYSLFGSKDGLVAALAGAEVYKALGAGDDLAHSSIRFGLGRWTTEEEVDYVVDKLTNVVARSDIPIGHKVALCDMAVGDTVWKYGIDMGKVVAPIKAGEHAHVHNIKTKRW